MALLFGLFCLVYHQSARLSTLRGAKEKSPLPPLTIRPQNATIKKNETEEHAMTEPTAEEILQAAEELLARFRAAFLELAK